MEEGKAAGGRQRNQGSNRRKKKVVVAGAVPPPPGDADVDMAAVDDTPVTITVKKKVDRGKIKKTSSLLSFGGPEEDEDEDEGGPVLLKAKKGSKHAPGLSMRSKKERTTTKTAAPDAPRRATIFSSAGEYSAERLAELKSSMKSLPAGHAAAGAADEDMIVAANADGALEDPTENETLGEYRMKPQESIPSAADIEAIKQMRKAARAGEEYIPLKSPSSAAQCKKPAAGTRLSDDDDDDANILGEEALSFDQAARKRSRRDRRKQVAAALENQSPATSESEDEEVENWERQHIRTGVSGLAPVDARAAALVDSAAQALRNTRLKGNREKPAKARSGPVDIDSIQLKLKEAMVSLRELHETHERHQHRVIHELTAIETEAPALQQGLEEATTRYDFFQNTRGFVSNLLSCLDEKVPQIEDEESKMHALWKEREDAALAARRQHLDDEWAVHHHACSPGSTKLPPQALNAAHERHSVFYHQRALQRQRQHKDVGYESDEDTEAGAAKFVQTRQEIQETASHIFDDVVEEFCDIQLIAEHFEEWKLKYPGEYRDAFVDLSLTKIIGPLVRLEMLNWNPLDTDCRAMDDMNWFHKLVLFGHHDDAMVEGDEEDHIVPQVVQHAVFPKLAGVLEFVYDPMSHAQTQRACGVVRTILHDFPQTETQTLLAAVGSRLKRAAQDDAPQIPLFPAAFLAQNTQAKEFFDYSCNRCLKLIEAIALWNGVGNTKDLQEAALTMVLQQRFVPWLSSVPPSAEVLDLCEKIVKRLPGDWFSSKATSAHQTVEPFVNLISNLCRQLQEADRSGPWLMRAGQLLHYLSSGSTT